MNSPKIELIFFTATCFFVCSSRQKTTELNTPFPLSPNHLLSILYLPSHPAFPKPVLLPLLFLA